MAIELWEQNRLFRVMTDPRLDPIPSFFYDRFFNIPHYSDDREIIFSKLPANDRKMAPFVLPSSQGKPVFSAQGETVTRFKPAYIKLKDAVRPADATTRRPSELLGNPMSLQERFDTRTAEVAAYHRRVIAMRMAHMAAKMITDAKYTFNYEGDQGAPYPEVLLDFGRDAGHTVVLSGSFWSDPDYDILSDIQTWMDRMRDAYNGGIANEIIVGSDVAKVFGKNNKLKAQMDTQYRGNDVNVRTGLIRLNEMGLSYVGSLGGGMEVWTYRDRVQQNDNSWIELLGPKEVLMLAPGIQGVDARGAIYDAEAMLAGETATDLYVKQWVTKDPGEVFQMTQTSPLLIPLDVNKTLKATVLA
jgi:hypothetical protein